jgi:hypothetical protein
VTVSGDARKFSRRSSENMGGARCGSCFLPPGSTGQGIQVRAGSSWTIGTRAATST